jgi:hypothetical protein
MEKLPIMTSMMGGALVQAKLYLLPEFMPRAGTALGFYVLSGEGGG